MASATKWALEDAIRLAAMPLPDRRPSPETAAAAPEDGGETSSTPPLPARKPKPPGPIHPRDAEAEPWSEEQITAGVRTCDELLRGLPITFEKLPPLREGICGTPAPIKVEAVGKDPAIAITPGAIMTCPMAAALARWVTQSVQPAARELLGAPVLRFQNFASYVCRNRYGDLNKPISEHAAANALDIGVFATSTAESVSVLNFWNAPPAMPLPLRAPPKDMLTETEKAAARHAVWHGSAYRKTARGVVRLARSQPAKVAAAPPPEPDKRSVFLRRIHKDACGIFGTVLGPEANAAHANHFHLDMAKRRHSAFCE